MAKSRTILLASFALVALQLALASEANAAAELSLSQGASSVVVIDNSVGDVDPQIGSIRFTGTVGGFTGTFGTGSTKPFNGSATQPQLFFTSTNLTTFGLGGTLTILFGDTDFGPVPNGIVSAQIGGTAFNFAAQPGLSPVNTSAGQVSYLTFMDSSNTPLGTGTALTTQGPLGGISFLNNVSGNATFGLNTALTQEIIINQGPNAVTGLNSTLRITSVLVTPDSGSAIILFAAALLALEGCRRRLRPAN